MRHLLPLDKDLKLDDSFCMLCGSKHRPSLHWPAQKCTNCDEQLGWACDACMVNGNWIRYFEGSFRACQQASKNKTVEFKCVGCGDSIEVAAVKCDKCSKPIETV